jgi:DMSO/TMAO reductase YedYZ molybdopterin-dependent catalytic subunit
MPSADHKEKSNVLPPGQFLIDHLLIWGLDHPLISKSVPEIDMENWSLLIEGEIENPFRLRWDELMKIEKVESVSNFHCVEGWSVLNQKWGGVRFRKIVEMVQPKDGALFVSIECADGYSTSLLLSDLLDDNVLLAYELNDEYLEKGVGAPLRLVVPEKYSYKSAMWITRIEFTKEKKVGFWESRGYSDTADVWENDRYST